MALAGRGRVAVAAHKGALALADVAGEARDVDARDEPRAVARVECLERGVRGEERPDGVGVMRKGVEAALRREGPELDRGCRVLD
jgi:hypothetical protein